MPYKAFISYSHTDEAALATAVQYALQHLAKPWYRLRTMSVFRDQTDLGASPGLWSSIEGALATTDFFVLVASPRAAQSPWIAKEVQWWLANRSVARLLIVLADGTLTWDAASLGFDAQASTALPACLLRAFPEEPLYVDCRFGRTAHLLSVRNPQFRDAILDLGATLLGRPKSELDSQDLREFRRTRRVLIAAVMALSVLSALTALEAHLANQQRDAAVAASLSIRAESLLGGNPELALLLAKKAYELQPSDDAAHALRHALSRNPERLFHLGIAGVPVNAKFAGRNAAFIAATSQAGPLAGQKAKVWDSRTGGKLAEFPLEVPGRVEPSSSPDGTRVALEVDEKRFAVYDTKDWQALKVLEGQEPRFSPDGRVIVALMGETGLRTWDAKSLATLATVTLNDEYELLDVSPDGSMAFVATQASPETSTAMAVLTASGAPVLSFDQHLFFDKAVLGDAGRTVIAPIESGQLEIWDLASRQKLRTTEGSTAQAQVGATSPSDGRLVVGTATGELHFWEPDLLHYRGAAQAHSAPVSVVKFSPDGKILLSAAEDGTASLQDVWRGRSIAAFGGPQDFVWGADVAADNDHILLSHMDGSVRVWSRYTWFPTHVLGTIARMSSDGQVLFAFGGMDETRRLLDVPSGKTMATFPAGRDTVLSIAVDKARQRLVVATTPGGVQFWDIASGKVTSSFQPAGADTRVVALSPDGKLLVTASSESGNFVWDVVSQKRIFDLSDLGNAVADLLFHPDGVRLFVASARGEIFEVNLETRKITALVEAVEDRAFKSVALSPDGQQLLVAGGQSAELWDLRTRSLVQSFSGHSDPVSAAAMSHDGRFVVTGGGFVDAEGPAPADRNEVILWDAESGRELLRYRSAIANIRKLAFGATSQDIIAVDLQARFYRCEVCVSGAELAALAETRAARELSPEERDRYNLNFGLGASVKTWSGKVFGGLEATRRGTGPTTAPRKGAGAPSSESQPQSTSRPGQKRSLTY